MKKTISNKNILYLLIGGFSLSLFLETSCFLGLITEDILIKIGQNSLLIFITNEGVQILSFILLIVFGIRFLSKKDFVINQLKSIIFLIITFYVVVQISQVLYRVYGGFSENDLRNHQNYTVYMGKHYMFYIISSLLSYAKYMIFALILFNYLRKDD